MQKSKTAVKRIRYAAQKNPLPNLLQVSFSGAENNKETTHPAKRIKTSGFKEIAKENNVPLVENRPLARALYAEVDVGEMVPENYYQALAVILANVYNMRGK